MPGNKSVLGNILLILLAVALVSFLVFAKIQERKEVSAAEKELQLKNNSEFEGVVSKLSDDIDMPGFVIWGDEGAHDGGSKLAEDLENAIDTKLFGSFQDKFSKIAMRKAIIDYDFTMTNMGVSGEQINEIIARSGARQIVTDESFVLSPDKGGKADVGLRDDAGNDLRFAEQEKDKFGETNIGGVKGRLVKGDSGYDEDHIKLAFARDDAGEEMDIAAGTPVETESAVKYKDCLPVLYFDEPAPDNDQENIDRAIKDFDLILQTHEKSYGEGKYIVIVCAEEGGDIDSVLSSEYGDHYIRVNNKAADMSAEDYAELASKVYDSLDKQGCFENAKAQVKKASKELEEL